MKQLFLDFVGEDDPMSAVQQEQAFELPTLLEIPNPAILHAYIRVLGWMGDYQGLLDTVQLMLKHQAELQRRRGMDRNGDVIMRRAIVAVRVFFERSWLAGNQRIDLPGEINKKAKLDVSEKFEKGFLALDREEITRASGQHLRRLERPAKYALIMEIKELVESVEEWGGWPTDEEVEEYCRNPRFQQFNR
jgi:hypothetical protein